MEFKILRLWYFYNDRVSFGLTNRTEVTVSKFLKQLPYEGANIKYVNARSVVKPDIYLTFTGKLMLTFTEKPSKPQPSVTFVYRVSLYISV